MQTARYASGAIYVPRLGNIVLGGRGSRARLFHFLRTAELLNRGGEVGVQAEWTWSALPSMLKPRAWPSVVYHDSRVFVASRCEDSIEMLLLHPDRTAQWTVISVDLLGDHYPNSMITVGDQILFSSRINQFC